VTPARAVRYIRTFALALRFVVQLWWLQRLRPLRGRRQAQVAARLFTRQANQFVAFATDMGGLIIKVGQFFSVRIDLLPKEYIDVLLTLQDSIPAVPTPDIVAVIEDELGQPLKDVFPTFDDAPIAAASLGQVHRATLPDETPIAVKVLRPGIEDLVATDLNILSHLLDVLDRIFRLHEMMDVEGLKADFTKTFGDELDYVKEGHTAEQFQRDLLFNPHVDIPKIYWEHSSRRVLTMEFMDGVRIDNLAAIDAWGIDHHSLAENLAGVFFSMVLTNGHFHADPHPGNVFVRSDGVIQLLDFGMVGTIEPSARADYTALLAALVGRDANGIVDALARLKFLGPGTDRVRMAELVGPHIDAIVGDVTGFYSGTSIVDGLIGGQVKLSVGPEQLAEIQRFVFSQPIILPANTAFLGKALVTVIGLCTRLDPGIDLLATAAPYVTGPTIWLETLKQARQSLKNVVPNTRRILRVAQRLGDGSFEADMGRLIESRIEDAQRRQNRTIIRVIALAAAAVAIILRRR